MSTQCGNTESSLDTLSLQYYYIVLILSQTFVIKFDIVLVSHPCLDIVSLMSHPMIEPA